MAGTQPRNRWNYSLTAFACLPASSLTFEKALALVDTGAVALDKRSHNAKLLAGGWDITLWHRLPSGPKQFANVEVWRYDRRDQHDFRWRDDLLALGFHATARDTDLGDPKHVASWTSFFLELGNLLRPDHLAVDLYDDFAERKGRDLTREVFAVNVFGPALAPSIRVDGAREIPGVRVEPAPWGGTVVRLEDRVSASEDPALRARVAAALSPA